ncbi:MAG: hypothetical protein ACJ8LG_13260 [Massilia sp.]
MDSFAGSCSIELAAEKLGKKVSGAFAALIGAAVKYRLIQGKGGKLSVTPLYREYKLAYTPQDAARQLQESFLAPPLFRSVYERFKNQKLPVAHFEKLLIKEFAVPDGFASRVVMYFLDGAKQCGVLNSDNHIVESGAVVTAQEDVDFVEEEKADPPQVDGSAPTEAAELKAVVEQASRQPTAVGAPDEFRLNLRGPGMDFSLEIREMDDLELVQVMLRKIEKALKRERSV